MSAPGGTTLVSEGDTGRAGTVLLVIGGVVLLGAAGMLLAAVGSGSIGLGLGGLALGAVGLLLLAAGLKERRKFTRLDPGLLDVAAPLFILSSSTPCRFRRTVKHGSATPTDLRARLVLREWVRYTVGTDTRTATQDVLEVPVPITPVPDPFGVTGDLTIHLPAYPPSFEAADNRVQWLLLVDLVLDDGFAEDSVFDLPVGTAVWAEEA